MGYLNLFSNLLPLGAGIYFWKRSSRSIRLLTGLLAYGVLSDVALYLLVLQSVNNMLLLHVYTIVSYLLLALLFSFWHEGKAGRIMRISIPLFVFYYFTLLALGYENLALPNKYSLTMRGMLVALISLYTLYSRQRYRATIPISEDERFWVSLGAFIVNSASIFVYAGIPGDITYTIWQIYMSLSILSNFVYFRAYLCMRN